MSKKASSPRELEAQILTNAATKFQTIVNDWDSQQHTLNEALLYNRKLWTIFVANASNPECPLPQTLRSNVANLGIFVFKRTFEIMTDPQPEKLQVLMSINRELAAGLRTG